MILIDENLRLRRFDGNYDFAFERYQDPDTVLLVDGKAEAYSYETLTNMYNYLNGKGIGKKVVSTFVERGRAMGYDKLYVGEIYDFNIGSQKCFESVGFRSYEKTEKGSRYVLNLNE